MKICLVTNTYPLNNQCHGAEYHIYHLAHHLSQTGHQVHVITQGKKTETIEDKEVTVHFVERSWRKFFKFFEKRFHITYFGALHYAALSRSITKKLKELLKTINFDLIEIPEGGGLGYFFFHYPSYFRPKTIIKIHSPLFYQQQFNNHHLKFPFEFFKQLNFKLIKHLELYCLKRADRLVAPSKAIAQVIKKELPKKEITITPHAINTNHFHPSPSTNYSLLTTPTTKILTVTTLSKLKGLDLLMESALKVIKKNPSITFHIIGKDTVIGAQNDSYKDYLVETYNLDAHKDQIIFEGYVPNDQILSHYQSADLFVLPSRTESFGLVILEAMACGIPPITFEVDALPEIITHEKNGILIPPFDTDSLAKEILNLEKNNEKRKELSTNALKTVKEYSLEKNLSQTINLYRETITN